MNLTFANLIDNLERGALNLLSPDDDVTHYMKVVFLFLCKINDEDFAQFILCKLTIFLHFHVSTFCRAFRLWG